MPDEPNIPLLDHELADDELAWIRAVQQDFAQARSAFTEREQDFDPKETLRRILAKEEHRLPMPMELTGPGPWRNGRNRHNRMVAAVFLPKVELHVHPKSRTDQFPIYVVGEADAFSLDERSNPVLMSVESGSHFHNPPGAPHAFLPKVGRKAPENWEIAFIAITPRNLREDTYPVSDAVRAAYQQAVGTEAPRGV